jgi:hypothetical protein
MDYNGMIAEYEELSAEYHSAIMDSFDVPMEDFNAFNEAFEDRQFFYWASDEVYACWIALTHIMIQTAQGSN